MKEVDVVGLGIETTTGSPVVMLREHDEPHRVLPIFVGPSEATAIALAVNGEQPPRPLTHDLMAGLVESLDGQVDAAEVTELHDGSFFARLAVHGPAGGQWLDTRPSDAIALAVRVGAPVFVSDEVLDEAAQVPEPDSEAAAPDPATIDETVAEFRDFLDDLDPATFALGPAGADSDEGSHRGDDHPASEADDQAASADDD